MGTKEQTRARTVIQKKARNWKKNRF